MMEWLIVAAIIAIVVIVVFKLFKKVMHAAISTAFIVAITVVVVWNLAALESEELQKTIKDDNIYVIKNGNELLVVQGNNLTYDENIDDVQALSYKQLKATVDAESGVVHNRLLVYDLDHIRRLKIDEVLVDETRLSKTAALNVIKGAAPPPVDVTRADVFAEVVEQINTMPNGELMVYMIENKIIKYPRTPITFVPQAIVPYFFVES